MNRLLTKNVILLDKTFLSFHSLVNTITFQNRLTFDGIIDFMSKFKNTAKIRVGLGLGFQ